MYMWSTIRLRCGLASMVLGEARVYCHLTFLEVIVIARDNLVFGTFKELLKKTLEF